MKEENKKKECFKALCFEYLSKLSLVDLRAYGRFLNISKPTGVKKQALIEEIIKVLCGENKPVRGKRGAPAKSNRFDEKSPQEIEKLKRKVFGWETAIVCQTKPNVVDEKQESESVVCLKFSIALEKLDAKQKQLLKDFLNSL